MLNKIWDPDTPFTNLLLPQQKLISRERVGAKAIKRHDQARTPHQRDLDTGVITAARNPYSPEPSTRCNPAGPHEKLISLSTSSNASHSPHPEHDHLTSTRRSSIATVRSFSVRQRITLPGGFDMKRQAHRFCSATLY